jgi:peptide/nickel transport system substrate-binding protein
MSGFYAIPVFSAGEQWIARWNRIEMPKTTSLSGYLPESWWQTPDPQAKPPDTVQPDTVQPDQK